MLGFGNSFNTMSIYDGIFGGARVGLSAVGGRSPHTLYCLLLGLRQSKKRGRNKKYNTYKCT